MNPSYGPARVEISGGQYDTDVIAMAKIDLLGESPQASAQLYIFEPKQEAEFDEKGKLITQERDSRFRPIDRLTQAKITGDDRHFIIEGLSEQLMAEVGLDPTEALVRWDVIPKGCADCR